jgi:hypothetical protein
MESLLKIAPLSKVHTGLGKLRESLKRLFILEFYFSLWIYENY